jgi:hypothetical protein
MTLITKMVTELVFDNATSVSNVLRRYWGAKHKSFLNIWQGSSPGHLIAGNQEGSNGDVSS